MTNQSKPRASSAYYVPLLREHADKVRSYLAEPGDETGEKARRIILAALDGDDPPTTVALAAEHDCAQSYVSRVLAATAARLGLPTVQDRRSSRAA